MSNMPAIQTYMAGRCDWNASVYAQKFFVEILMVLKKQKEWDNQGIKPIAYLNNVDEQEIDNKAQLKIPYEESNYDDHK